MNEKTKKMVTAAMLAALSYLAVAVGRIPLILFLKYDPKDIIITIGGFIFGPLVSLAISTVVAFAEFLTFSNDGILGLIMNIIASAAFCCTAACIYKKKRTAVNALTGLILGCAAMTAVMLLWNYLISPLYMNVPRSEVIKLLIPAFLPFNLIKGGLNAGITMLIYKPVVTALRKANLLPVEQDTEEGSKKKIIGVMLIAALIIITCILYVLAVKGIL